MSILLGSSRRNEMRPLSFRGTFATDCYPQLNALLARMEADLASRGMPHARTFLAEPMHDPRTGNIDWYAEGGRAVRVADLPAEEREEVRDTMACYGKALAAALGVDGNGILSGGLSDRSGSSAVGRQLLLCALKSPDFDRDVYLVDGHPVLANWGFESGSGVGRPVDIIRMGAERVLRAPLPPSAAPMAPLAPMPVPPPVPPADPVAAAAGRPDMRGCLGWLLPLLLLLLLLWLLLAMLGALPSPLPASCMRAERIDDSALLEHSAGLADEYARLYPRLQERARLCRRPQEDLPSGEADLVPDAGAPLELPAEQAQPAGVEPVEEPAVPAEEPADPAEEAKEPEMPFFGEDKAQAPEEKAPDMADQQPQMPFFGEDAKKQDEPQQQPAGSREGEKLAIPENAGERKGVDFLEGCWGTGSGLVESEQGTPVVVEYCFDRNGRGHRIIREKDSGAICRSSASAAMKGNRLKIDAARADCKGASRDEYVPQSIECTGKGASTRCKGRESDKGGNVVQWDADFARTSSGK